MLEVRHIEARPSSGSGCRASGHGAASLMVMMLMSALLVGFFAVIAADQQASGVNRDQTQAYAAAHAGLEKLTADLGALFTGGNFSPSAAQVNALTATRRRCPASSSWRRAARPATRSRRGGPDRARFPTGRSRASGPDHALRNQRDGAGDVAAFGGAAEVRMRREVQTVAVPVFQFGDLLRERPLVLRRPRFRLRRPRPHQPEHLPGAGRRRRR